MAENKSTSTKKIKVQYEISDPRQLKRFQEMIKDLGKDFDVVEAKIKRVSKAQKKMAEEVAKSAQNMKQFASRIKTYVDYRIINVAATSIKNLAKSTIDLESSFANIQAITRSTDATMTKLQKTILKVGEASKYSVTEIADATTILGQAGLSAEEINNVLETTTQLAAATGSSLADTIDLMTSSLAVWGVSSEEATHLSDVMVTGMNRTKATLQTFRMAVQYAGATMASLNVNFDEFAAVASAAANAGIKASVVGTGLRAVASELISPTTKMVKGLAKLGLTTNDVNIESNGLVNVLKKLKDAGLDASNAYSLFGRRAAQFILAAQGQLDVVDDLQLAFVESGATLEAYSKQMSTVAAEWTALANTVKEAAYKTIGKTNGFLKSMIVNVKNGLRVLFFDYVDFANDEIKKVDNSISNLKRYSDLIKDKKYKDYGGDDKKQLEEYNSLIKSLNTVYGLNLDIADSVEGISDKYDDVINKVEQFRKYLTEGRNEAVNMVKKDVLDTKLQFRLFGASDDSDYKNYAKIQYEHFVTELYKAGENVNSVYAKLLSEENKKFDKEISKLRNNITRDNRDVSMAIIESKKRIHLLNKSILEASFKAVKLPETINYEEKKIVEDALFDLDKSRVEILKSISDSFGNTKEDLDKYLKNPSGLLEQVNTDITSKIEELNKILDKENISALQITNSKKYDEIKNKIGELSNALESKLNEAVLNKIDIYTKIFSEKNKIKFTTENKTQIEGLQKLKNSIMGKISPEEGYLERLKQESKDTASYKRTAKEIEREKAKEYNKRYQNLKLQSQADSYAQSTAEALRKGIISKLNTRDTSGVLAGYYSSTASDLSKLESLRTAIKKKDTLEEYKKKYGDIFEQVKSGKVTLDDADNKTASLIKEMLDLDKAVNEATGEFGDLNNIDLSNVDEQITSLQGKLNGIEESTEVWYKKLGYGFAATIESMAKSYSLAKLGSSIAEDLGDGMADALNSIVDGSKSAKEAFSDMARSILEDISRLLIKMAVLKAFEAAVGMVPENMGGQSSGWNPATSAPSAKPMASGGFIPKTRAAGGVMVRGGVPGRDSVPAMLMPGEYVLKKSAVDALGTNFLNDLNNNAAQTLTKTAANLMDNAYESKQDSEPAVVNVWVVSKEDEAKMGPNDVIATISKDIMTGGTTRRLIQSVVAGRK